MKMLAIASGAATMLVVTLAVPVHAQDRTIKLIYPFAAGG